MAVRRAPAPPSQSASTLVVTGLVRRLPDLDMFVPPDRPGLHTGYVLRTTCRSLAAHAWRMDTLR